MWELTSSTVLAKFVLNQKFAGSFWKFLLEFSNFFLTVSKIAVLSITAAKLVLHIAELCKILLVLLLLVIDLWVYVLFPFLFFDPSFCIFRLRLFVNNGIDFLCFRNKFWSGFVHLAFDWNKRLNINIKCCFFFRVDGFCLFIRLRSGNVS